MNDFKSDDLTSMELRSKLSIFASAPIAFAALLKVGPVILNKIIKNTYSTNLNTFYMSAYCPTMIHPLAKLLNTTHFLD